VHCKTVIIRRIHVTNTILTRRGDVSIQQLRRDWRICPPIVVLYIIRVVIVAAPVAALVAAPVAASKDHAVAEEKKERKKGPRKSAPEPAEEVQQRGNKKQRLSLKQVKAIQRQTVRMERYHQSEMDSAARDTLALAGVDSDGDY
jgi:hypothetical protein